MTILQLILMQGQSVSSVHNAIVSIVSHYGCHTRARACQSETMFAHLATWVCCLGVMKRSLTHRRSLTRTTAQSALRQMLRSCRHDTILRSYLRLVFGILAYCVTCLTFSALAASLARTVCRTDLSLSSSTYLARFTLGSHLCAAPSRAQRPL